MGASPDFEKPAFGNVLDTDIDAIRDNYHFLLMVAASGSIVLPGWQTTVTATDYSQPDTITLTRGTKKIHIHYVWTDNAVSSIQMCYDDGVSSPGLTCFDAISFYYDDEGNPTGTIKPWATTEYLAVQHNHATTDYVYIDLSGASEATLASITMPDTTYQGIVSDSTFVFVNGPANGECDQYKWDGVTLTRVLRAVPDVLATNPLAYMVTTPSNPGVVVASGIADFGRKLMAFTTESAPTYAYTTSAIFDNAGRRWRTMMDFREPELTYTEGFGNSIVAVPVADSGEYFESFTVSGVTITERDDLQLCTKGANTHPGWGRDTGLIVSTASTILHLYQVNLTTGVLSSIGTSTSFTGTTVYTAAVIGDIIVLAEDSGYFRSYSRSGTTLTLLDTLNAGTGFNSTSNRLLVSPFSNKIYSLSSTAGKSLILDCATDGTLTQIMTFSKNTTAVDFSSQKIAFIGAEPLPTL